ncbi:hypothetical protein [Caenimonas sp. SL110]|uniref:hypothetical protein n=1 Tax=Caenimonas sp. SL110 TaxID=1450524 RepID=UPI0009E1C7C1|nr:hypothetical protein [Caenimonas sp. SL110]
MKRFAAIALLPLVLAACASDFGYDYHNRDGRGRPGAVMPNPPPTQAHPLARTATYTCEDLSTVSITEGTDQARVRTNSGLELALARRPLTGAFLYGDRTYEFRGNGDMATLAGNGKVWRCRLK